MGRGGKGWIERGGGGMNGLELKNKKGRDG